MRKEYFTIDELSQYMLIGADRYGRTMHSVLLYEQAKQLVKSLLQWDVVELDYADFEDVEYGGYDREYYISLTNDLKLSVEKAWHDANEFHNACYFSVVEGMLLISGDANSAILKANKGCTFIELEIIDTQPDDDEDDDEDGWDEYEDDDLDNDYNVYFNGYVK